MSDISENGVTVVTGEIVEKSASLCKTDERNQNIGTLYPFIIVKTDEGEIIRINNLVADVHCDRQITLALEPRFI